MKLEPSTGVKGTKVKITLSADAARKVMAKPNNKYETVIEVSTETAEFTINFDAEETVSVIYIMVDTDVQTSSGSFTIHSIVIE